MKYLLLSMIIMMLAATSSLQARFSAYEFDSPEQEETYKKLIGELRCLVCQNQNIADSNAELAQDLKRKTYELVKQGKSRQEISDFMVERYGDFVLYRPPVTSTTYLLWVGPFIILALGVFILYRVVRSRKTAVVDGLSKTDKDRAAKLLNTKGD